MNAILLAAAVVVGTWNGNWFPSGRAEHRAHPDVEAATVSAVAKMLRTGIDAADPSGTNDIVLCLCEIRGPRVASNLVAQIGRPGLRVAVTSGYRRRDRFDQQQNVIATTLPVADARWGVWKGGGKARPPRGYAFAALVFDPAVTASVYAVHLKSNYGGRNPETAALNRDKRTAAVRQLAALDEGDRAAGRPAIVAGDMNADPLRKEFAGEELFGILADAGFADAMELLPPGKRGTHPSKRWGDSALDHVFYRGIRPLAPPLVHPCEGLSDHSAVFAVFSTAP